MPRDERTLLILSDIEIGAGGVTDDFPEGHDAWLAELIERRAAARGAVDLVLNGDTFDFLKTPVDGAWPRHVDAALALAKLEAVAAAHPGFFEALRRFLAGGADRRVVFVVGNHDAELVLPELRAAIRARLGGDERVVFAGFAWRQGDVHVEHGQQSDVMFAVDPARPLARYEGRPIVALPWGSVALLEVAMPMQPLLYHFDRLRPRERIFELMPETRELLVGAFWRYWTRDYLADLVRRRDPLKRLTWTMFKEIVHRLGSADPDVRVADRWRDALQRSQEVRLVVLGHEHRPSWWTWGDRKILRSGCLRAEFALRDDGSSVPLPKQWVEAHLVDGRVVSSQILEAPCPPLPQGYVPTSVFDILPDVRRLLGTREERTRLSRALTAQEAAEARAPEARAVEAVAARHPHRTLGAEEE